MIYIFGSYDNEQLEADNFIKKITIQSFYNRLTSNYYTSSDYILIATENIEYERNGLIEISRYLDSHPHISGATGYFLKKVNDDLANLEIILNPDFIEGPADNFTRLLTTYSGTGDYIFRVCDILELFDSVELDDLSLLLCRVVLTNKKLSAARCVMGIKSTLYCLQVNHILYLYDQYSILSQFSKHYYVSASLDIKKCSCAKNENTSVIFPLSINYQHFKSIAKLLFGFPDECDLLFCTNSYCYDIVLEQVKLLNIKTALVKFISNQFVSANNKFDFLFEMRSEKLNLLVFDLIRYFKPKTLILTETSTSFSKTILKVIDYESLVIVYPHVSNLLWTKKFNSICKNYASQILFKIRNCIRHNFLSPLNAFSYRYLSFLRFGTKIDATASKIIEEIVMNSGTHCYNIKRKYINPYKMIVAEFIANHFNIKKTDKHGLSTDVSFLAQLPYDNAVVYLINEFDVGLIKSYTRTNVIKYSTTSFVANSSEGVLIAISRIYPNSALSAKKFLGQFDDRERNSDVYVRLHPRATDDENRAVLNILEQCFNKVTIVRLGDKNYEFYNNSIVYCTLSGSLFECIYYNVKYKLLRYPNVLSDLDQDYLIKKYEIESN